MYTSLNIVGRKLTHKTDTRYKKSLTIYYTFFTVHEETLLHTELSILNKM